MDYCFEYERLNNNSFDKTLEDNRYTYPIQNAHTREMIRKLKTELASASFYFTGRFADWEYYNMDVAIGAAMDLCKTIK